MMLILLFFYSLGAARDTWCDPYSIDNTNIFKECNTNTSPEVLEIYEDSSYDPDHNVQCIDHSENVTTDGHQFSWTDNITSIVSGEESDIYHNCQTKLLFGSLRLWPKISLKKCESSVVVLFIYLLTHSQEYINNEELVATKLKLHEHVLPDYGCF